ncbi:GNAT family N-acetyltransferase [Arhodomonas sp. AD133]|uniref:GNAT family N-acetyltransferase n=1 Tax=Arhodomonas sp. AD133 TaxID=3415009 RepID=UPI003EB89A83
MDITIRVAEHADAQAVTRGLRRSIREICHPDHQGDEAIIGQWLANKTVANVAQWLTSPQALALVAVADDQLVGIGMLSRSGEVLLCYVAPEVVGQGVGHRLLRALLHTAEEWKLEHVYAESTATARSFYLRNGFEPVSEPVVDGGIRGYPMRRRVAAGA